MAFVVGRVVEITGSVRVKNNDSNTVRSIDENSVVYQNETILTPQNSSLSLELIDGRMLSLGGHLTHNSALVLSYLVPFDAINGIVWDSDVTFDALKQAIQQNQLTPLSKFMQDLTEAQKLALQERLELFQKTETLFDAAATQPDSANHGAVLFDTDVLSKQDFFYQRLALEGNVTAGYETNFKRPVFKQEEDFLSEVDSFSPAPQLILVGSSSVLEGSQGHYELMLDLAPSTSFTATIKSRMFQQKQAILRLFIKRSILKRPVKCRV